MLSEIRLTNFQGFKQTEVIPLKPLTLIFGPNSSGKSSLFRSMLLLKQSFRSLSRDEGRFSFVDSDVDLGGFANAVHAHEIVEDIGIGVTVESPQGKFSTGVDFKIRHGDFVSGFSMSRSESFSGSNDEPDKYFQVDFVEDPIDERQFKIDLDNFVGIEYFLELVNTSKARNDIRRNLNLGDSVRLSADDLKHRFSESIFKRSGLFASGRESAINLMVRNDSGAIDVNEVLKGKQSNSFWFHMEIEDVLLSRSQRNLASHLAQMQHLRGLRAIPDRISAIGSASNNLLADASNIVSRLSTDPGLVAEASKWVKKLTGGAYELDLIKINDRHVDFLGDIGSLILKDTRLNTTTTFQDVGVGLSQVLPIIASLIQKSPRRSNSGPKKSEGNRTVQVSSTLLIEQPELHLHPRIQADLADLLIESSAAKNLRGPQVLVETHSESMILRIQRRIREGKINPDRIGILYVDRDKKTGVSRCTPLPLDVSGEFLAAWPEDFGLIRLDEILP